MKKMIAWFHEAMAVAVVLATPNTFRAIFMGRTRVAFYLKGGAVYKITVRKWEYQRKTQHNWNGALCTGQVDHEEIVAVKEILWW